MMVKCPTCKKSVEWSAENTFKPFCCERCKLIDFGEWLFEEKRIPADEAEDILIDANLQLSTTPH